MVARVIYYLLSVVVGVLVSLIVIGSSVFTNHYLNGRAVDEQMTNAEFIVQNFSGLKTKTIIDYDGLFSIFSGKPTNLFSGLQFEGDMTTPGTINFVLLALNTALVVAIAWLVRRGYLRFRARRSQDARTT